ncbi:MAG: amidohydrolase, partial [Acidobacteria bacterium]
MRPRCGWLALAAVVVLGASVPAAAQAPAAKKGKAPAVSVADARLEGLKRAVTAEIDGMAALTQQMVDSLFSFAEPGFQEFE